MKLAIPLWQGKVSSMFDFADELLLIAEQFLGLWLTCLMALELRYYLL